MKDLMIKICRLILEILGEMDTSGSYDDTPVYLPTVDVPSPSDIVPKKNILFNRVEQVVKISLKNLAIPFTKPPKVWVPDIPGSKSMDPVFDWEHNNILIQGADAENQSIMADFLKVGDIAVYRHPLLYAIHRIVKIEQDDEGRKFTFKGDNNYTNDPYAVRDEHIEWLSIGTIY